MAASPARVSSSCSITLRHPTCTAKSLPVFLERIVHQLMVSFKKAKAAPLLMFLLCENIEQDFKAQEGRIHELGDPSIAGLCIRGGLHNSKSGIASDQRLSPNAREPHRSGDRSALRGIARSPPRRVPRRNNSAAGHHRPPQYSPPVTRTACLWPRQRVSHITKERKRHRKKTKGQSKERKRQRTNSCARGVRRTGRPTRQQREWKVLTTGRPPVAVQQRSPLDERETQLPRWRLTQ